MYHYTSLSSQPAKIVGQVGNLPRARQARVPFFFGVFNFGCRCAAMWGRRFRLLRISKQLRLFLNPAKPPRHLEVIVSPLSSDPPSRRPVQKSKLNQIMLVNFFNRLRFLTNRSRNGVDP